MYFFVAAQSGQLSCYQSYLVVHSSSVGILPSKAGPTRSLAHLFFSSVFKVLHRESAVFLWPQGCSRSCSEDSTFDVSTTHFVSSQTLKVN